MSNPRHKERHYIRNGRDLLNIGLKAADGLERGKPFFEALGDAFKAVRTDREQEELEHPVGPGMPIGFRSPAAKRSAERAIPAGITTVMKAGIYYCVSHDIPVALCATCRARSESESR